MDCKEEGDLIAKGSSMFYTYARSLVRLTQTVVQNLLKSRGAISDGIESPAWRLILKKGYLIREKICLERRSILVTLFL